MKTKRSKSRELPQPIKILFFICGIAAVCLPNWIALKAGKPVTDPAELVNSFADIIVIEADPEIELEDWMLSFDEFHIVADVEPELKLEDWMLNFGYEVRYADATEEKVGNYSSNLKPFTEEWISEFETHWYSDLRIRY
ncbi:MAG TPA: hypothetical protein ENI20_12135 [Bacteroides sp.]|nr:hypothetical protein [Bacteroides sp.]